MTEPLVTVKEYEVATYRRTLHGAGSIRTFAFYMSKSI